MIGGCATRASTNCLKGRRTGKTKLKRILFAVDGLAGGGAERVFIRLAGALAGRGHYVAIANLRDVQAYLLPPAVRLIPSFDTAPPRLRRLGEIGRRARLLNAALSDGPDPDLVVSTLLTTDRIVRRSRVADRAWYRVPNALSLEFLSGVSASRKARRLARIRALYRNAKVVAVSHGVARELTKQLGVVPARLEVIPNPYPVVEIQRLAAASCPHEGSDFLVSVGRFSRQKRPDRLLGAFARSGFDGRLVFVGTGTESEIRSLRDRIAALNLTERVDLVGFQANPYPWMRHARALVLASDYEGFPNALVEALICGTPVASTRCPFGPEEILTGALARGLADLTEQSLAEAIGRVVEAPPDIPPERYQVLDVPRITDRYLALAD